MCPSGKGPKSRTARAAAGIPGNKEVEVKLRLDDLAAMRKRLARLGARIEAARLHEMNTLYDTSEGSLAASGQLIRIRIERPANAEKPSSGKSKAGDAPMRALLTHKGPPGGQAPSIEGDSQRYKIREEEESEIENPGEMAKVFEAMGLLPWFRYEKYRTGYRLPGISGVKVELDETPIGNFLELEGNPSAIDRAAKRLGFGPEDYITMSYGALFVESLGRRGMRRNVEPRPADRLPDMVFPLVN